MGTSSFLGAFLDGFTGAGLAKKLVAPREPILGFAPASDSFSKQSFKQNTEAQIEILHQALEDLERSYDITLEALGDALDLKDSETEGHSKRVTAYTIALGRAMGIGSEGIRVMARAAFLHNIGKIALPDAILLKPGKLTPDEQSLMREHCERGYNILRKIPFLAEAAEIVYSHQEHFDGSGYPRGISANAIPIGARIFAVAEALDTITSDRPYRVGKSFDVARMEILRCSGTQFDPAVVEIFLKIPNELWIELRTEITGKTPFPAIVGKVIVFSKSMEGTADTDPLLAGSHRHAS